MCELYNKIMELCDAQGITGYRLCKDTNIQPSVLTDLKMGRQNGLSAKNADKIAKYFGVSVGVLLGTEDEKKPPESTGRLEKMDEELSGFLFALYGETKDYTEAQRQDLLDYARYVKMRGKKE